jgi:hypothetical protein
MHAPGFIHTSKFLYDDLANIQHLWAYYPHARSALILNRSMQERKGTATQTQIRILKPFGLRFWYISKHDPTCWFEHWIVVRNSSTSHLVLGQKSWFKWLLRVSIFIQVRRQTVLDSDLRARKRCVPLLFCTPQSRSRTTRSGLYSRKVES